MIEEYTLKSDALHQRLKIEIESGKFAPGSRLPNERTLAEQYGVARGTLRLVLDRLESEGLLVRLPSKGTFVPRIPLQKNPRKFLALLTLDYSDITNPSQYLIPGMKAACLSRNIELEICPLAYISTGKFADLLKKLKQEKQLDGFFTFGGRFTGEEDFVKIFHALEKPVVMVECYKDDVAATGFAGVRIDFRKAWHDGILALKSKGHTRIAIMNGSFVRGYEEDPDQFHEFLSSENIFEPALIKSVAYEYRQVRKAFEEFVRMSPPPTAIICFSDFYAIHVYQAASEMGIRIPCDVSVMGYCGYPGSRFLTPPLSTVDFNYFKTGEKAVELLCDSGRWFNRDAATPDIVMPHKITMRESVAQV